MSWRTEMLFSSALMYKTMFWGILSAFLFLFGGIYGLSAKNDIPSKTVGVSMLFFALFAFYSSVFLWSPIAIIMLVLAIITLAAALVLKRYTMMPLDARARRKSKYYKG